MKCGDKDTGIIGGKIYFPGEPLRFQAAGSCINRWTGMTYHRFENQIDTGQADDCYEPDFVIGAAFLLTRRMLEKIGMFDENYFMYYEETDLCVRVKEAGFKILYVPTSQVSHCEKERWGYSKRAFMQFYLLRNNIIFMRKHANFIQKMFFYCYLFFYRTPREIARSLAGRAGKAAQVFRAVKEGMTVSIRK